MKDPSPMPATAAQSDPPWLVADIGGTNARFGCVDADHQGFSVRDISSLAVADHASPAAAARAYLDALAAAQGSRYRAPQAAAFAVATAVAGDEARFTNSGWRLSRLQTQADLGLRTLLLLNDFEALALSLPRLQATQRLAVGRPASSEAGMATDAASGARAVIGPGTGLGVAGLLPTAHGWVAVPGEGGHASLSAADDVEAALLAAVRRLHPHVSAERLLSGIGLPVLHQALAEVGGTAAARLAAHTIVERGVDGSDPLCRQTLEHFCAFLGSFAGNVALVLGARGGVYIGGGIVPRLGPLFMASAFRQRFEAKGRFEAYLQQVPTWLITDTLAALLGAAQALAQRGR